jgi:serine/threonine protein kinase
MNTLKDYIKNNISLEQCLKWGLEFCHGMENVINSGIKTHRDIKPGNIMITPDKHLKITDFGLAKIWDEIIIDVSNNNLPDDAASFLITNKSKKFVGTPPWAAPEQFNGISDERSDIYSFGIVLYQMINKGGLPFNVNGSTVENWYKAHKYNEPPELNSVLYPIIKKCLEKLPEKRYQSFKDLRKALEDLYVTEINSRLPPIYKKSEMEAWDYSNRGYSFYHHGMIDNAKEQFKKALELDETHVVALNNLTIIYIEEKNFEKALEYVERAIDIDPEFHGAWGNKAGILLEKKDYDGALKSIDIAIKLHPSSLNIFNKGVILRYKGEYEDAIKFLKKAKKMNPKFIEGYNEQLKLIPQP